MENVQISEYLMKAANGKHIRRATVITIDGEPIRFTEKLTAGQVKRYLERRLQQQHQAKVHAAAEAFGG